MKATDVLRWLKEQSESDGDADYSVKDITKGLLDGDETPGERFRVEDKVRRLLLHLWSDGFIDCSTRGWRRRFKYKG